MKKLLSLLLLAPGAVLANDAAMLSCRAIPEVSACAACYDAIPLAANGAAKTPEQAFGLKAPVKKKEEGPASFQARVDGTLDGWTPGARIRLANGQVWRVTDDSEAVLPRMSNPQVEISRGLLGSYFLQVVGHTNTARVVRIE